MRFVVFGAGAIGGLVGGRLAQAGHDVRLVARGAHLQAIRDQGLQIESPEGCAVVPVPAVADPSAIDWRDGDVVLLAVKSHQTPAALDGLAASAPPSVPVVCLQNGIANEPATLRLFANVYAVTVMCPASHLEPGIVQAWSSPVAGLLDIGRHPAGTDATTEAVAAAFRSATFDSNEIADIWRWQLRKLLTNLANVVEAVCGPHLRRGLLARILVAEGEAALAAAGFFPATVHEDRERRGDLLRIGEIDGRRYEGGSSWQSAERRTGNIETDYLNGEVVLLGRLHGVPTPANALMQQHARSLALGRRRPGTLSEEAVLDELGRGG